MADEDFEGFVNTPIGGYVLDDCLTDFALKKKMVDPGGCFVFFVNRGRVVGAVQMGSGDAYALSVVEKVG